MPLSLSRRLASDTLYLRTSASVTRSLSVAIVPSASLNSLLVPVDADASLSEIHGTRLPRARAAPAAELLMLLYSLTSIMLLLLLLLVLLC